jgi:hypothetical protein
MNHSQGSRPVTPPDWSLLDAALARARETAPPVVLWWRDDDAVAHTPALDRLLTLANRLDLPVALAVIPAGIETSLVERLADEPRVGLLVHGLRHTNHAPPGARRAEFGDHRPLAALAAEAAAGLTLARSRFGARMQAVLAPPWNRLAPALVASLPALGYYGLSTFGDRPAPEPAPGLTQVNAHLDPIAWRAGRGLADPDALVADLARRIAQRPMAGAEPIGLLTHHLVHDEAVWTFCEGLLEHLAGHAGVRFAPLDAMFPADRDA